MRIWIMCIVVVSLCAGVSHGDELSDVKRENQNLNAENIALKAQIDALSRRLATVQTERAALDSKFGALSRRLASIENGINGMQNLLSKQMQEAIDRIALLETGGKQPPRIASNNPRTNPTNTRPYTNPTRNNPPAKGSDPVKPKTGSTFAKADTNTNTSPIVPRVKDPVIKPRIRIPRSRDGQGLPTTVAVVDMVEVFANLREKAKVEESLADLVYAVKFQDKKWSDNIRALSLDLKLLEKGSLAYLEKEHEIEKARIQWRVDIEAARAALNRKRGERMKELYTRMANVCGRVANDHGFDMILFKEPEPKYENFRSVADLAGSRMVLRANDSIDLTDQVIRVLNREFLTNSPSR